jgi:thymidylate kinase
MFYDPVSDTQEAARDARGPRSGKRYNAAGEGALTGPERMSRSLRNFLLRLFELLDEHRVGYCVLHSWEKLPDELPNDLDLAVLKVDRSKLLLVFSGLRADGYFPIQTLNHSANGNFFVFCWTQPDGVKTAAVDIVSEHRRGGMRLARAEEMVANRERCGAFWAASAQIEFAYLLAKKSFKRKASESQSRRLTFLVQKLGISLAEELASGFLPADSYKQAVASCSDGSTQEFLRDGRKALWRRSLSRPWKAVPYFAREGARLVRRWFRPTGVTVAILGPDGVGKSSVITGLVKNLDVAFWRRHRVFHWRPNIIAPKPDLGPDPNPHGKSPRGSITSMVYLAGFFLDYLVGYVFVLRPLRAKSNLLLFDRYFHDALVDPQRYRYGGPKWFAERLARMVPEPDLVILLDAETATILGRKAELPGHEIERQRKAYQALRFGHAVKVTIKTDDNVDDSVCGAAAAVAEYMTKRFDERFQGSWSSAGARDRAEAFS